MSDGEFKKMNSLNRIRAAFSGEKPDLVGTADFYWGETIVRWQKEGMDSESPDDYFDNDIIFFHFDPRFGFEERLISEDEHYLTFFSIDGLTVKVPKDKDNLIAKSDAVGYPIDYLIKGRTEWDKYKYFYQAGRWRLHSNPRFSGSWFGYKTLDDYRKKYEKALANDKFKCLVFREPYECIREILGTDNILIQMAADPELIKEMLQQALKIILEMVDLIKNLGMKMDGYWVWGDIAYNQGMFFSPRTYRDLLMPLHKELFRHLGENVIYHTDGNLREALPLLVEAGIKGINPLEIKAGNDFYKIVDEYGDKLVITGGIDVRILSTNDRKKIEQEIKKKIEYAKKKRYIYHSDHSIPPDINLETYRFIIDTVKTYGKY